MREFIFFNYFQLSSSAGISLTYQPHLHWFLLLLSPPINFGPLCSLDQLLAFLQPLAQSLLVLPSRSQQPQVPEHSWALPFQASHPIQCHRAWTPSTGLTLLRCCSLRTSPWDALWWPVWCAPHSAWIPSLSRCRPAPGRSWSRPGRKGSGRSGCGCALQRRSEP